MAVEKREGGDIGLRAALGLVGAAAGTAYWVISDKLPDVIESPHAYLLIAALAGGYLGAFMLLVGPLRLRHAAWAAALTAVPAALLLTWASLRYEALEPFLARPGSLAAYAIVLALPLPYLIAARRSRRSWRDYPTLFDESWSLVVRLGAAALFSVLVWLAVLLADQLLQLVGIDLIARLIERPYVPPVFTGLIAGIALAVVDEMEEFVSPSLLLRLLRVLVPPALLVVGAFTLAIPFQGLDALFGTLSPSATLLTIAVVLATLVTSAVDVEDETAVRSAGMRWATRALALLIPVIALLALEALRIRVAAEGLSPGRLGAMMAGAMLFLYGLLYAAAVLSGARWMGRIRAVNAWMALAVIALAVLWLTPVLNAERLSARDQVARFAEGRTEAGALDLWTLRHDWGHAGRAAVARIEAMAAGHPEEELLRERIRLSASAPDRVAFGTVVSDPGTIATRAELKEVMPVVPSEARAEFDRYVLPWYAGSVAAFLEGCRDLTDTGRPGCVLVVHDLIPDNPGNEAILFYKSFGLLRGEVIVPEPVFRRAEASEIFGVAPPDFRETDAILEALQDGAFTAGPARLNAITIGPRQFTVPY